MARRRTRRKQRGGRDETDITDDIQNKIKDLEQLRIELEEEKARKAAASDKAKSRWGKIGTTGLAQIGVEKAKKTLAEIEQKKEMESTADDILSETDLSPPSKPSVKPTPVVQKEKMSNTTCKKKTCATTDNECGEIAKKQGKVPCEQKGDCVLSKKSNGVMVCTNPDSIPSGTTRVGTGGRSRRRRRRKRNKTRKGKRTKKRRRRKRKRTRKR